MYGSEFTKVVPFFINPLFAKLISLVVIPCMVMYIWCYNLKSIGAMKHNFGTK